MAKKYDVSITFRRKVSQKQLAGAVKSATGAKVKGFKMEDLSTHKSYDEPSPVRIVTRTKSSKSKK